MDEAVRVRLLDIATTHPYESRRLRAVWVLHVIGALTPDATEKLLADRNEFVRAWAIQLALDCPEPNLAELVPRFEELAANDPSPVVRLYLASALQQLPLEQRWTILERLVAHAEDASDHNLPLMLWYAAEPLAKVDSSQALDLALPCGKSIPIIREFMIRRIASLNSQDSLAALVSALGKSNDPAVEVVMLREIRRALQGQRHVQMPSGWQETLMSSSHAAAMKKCVRRQRPWVLPLAMRSAMTNCFSSFPRTRRPRLPDAKLSKPYWQRKTRDSCPHLQHLLLEPNLRDTALSGLALFDDPHTPDAILAVYSDLPLEGNAGPGHADFPSYREDVLHAIADEKLPPSDLTADLVRQLHNFTTKKSTSTRRTVGNDPRYRRRQGSIDRQVPPIDDQPGPPMPIRNLAGLCLRRLVNNVTRCTESVRP